MQTIVGAETKVSVETGGKGSWPEPDPWRIEPHGPERARLERPPLALGSKLELAMSPKARILPNISDQAVVERYRKLRTKLIQEHGVKAFRSLMVTSALPQEGKTLTTANLALTFAMIPSFRVVVVDGDLRRGTFGKWLGAEARPGLSNLLDGSATLNDVVLKSDAFPAHLVLAGTSTIAAAELMQVEKLREQIGNLSDHFDLVLVDSPPVNLVTDAQLLASSCDALLLVARAYVTTRKSFEAMVREVHHHRIVGSVLNGGTHFRPYKGYEGYY